MNQTEDLLPLPNIVRVHDDGVLPVKRAKLPKKQRVNYKPTPYMVGDNGRWHRVYVNGSGRHYANFNGEPTMLDVKE